MSRNVKISLIILLVLIIGLILFVLLARKITQTQQNASGNNNLNSSSQNLETKNKDFSMGPSSFVGNYSAKLSKENLGSLTFSITDPPAGKPTFPPRIPTVTPDSGNSVSAAPTAKGIQKVKSLVIRIKKIEVHLKGTASNVNINKWETINLQTPMSFDLAQLINGAVVNFSLTKLAVGNYDEVRVYIDKADSILENGQLKTLEIAGKDGIIRIQKDFVIEKAKNTNLLIDFDAQQSVEFINNKFILKPFIVRLDINN